MVDRVVISSGMRRLMTLAHSALRRLSEPEPSSRPPGRTTQPRPSREPSPRRHAYPGDAVGPVDIQYRPRDDTAADPGEVVWAWVPYEEDHTRGKDRPALVIGWDGEWLLALPVTSRDHDRDAEEEAAAGRFWIDIGRGAWDRRGRPSEARVDRIVRLHPDEVRRTGGRLAKPVFDVVAQAVRGQR